jgi:vacuolar-type H+-ATPase subunit I/STV1
MTNTEIKLSAPMVAALKTAQIIDNTPQVTEATRVQTVKGLISRGLVLADSRVLSPEGVEAARQLGQDLTVKAPEVEADSLTDDAQVAQQDEEIQAVQDLLKAVDLDKPIVVPNREDKRKVKFSLRGALARLAERKRVRQVKKYGTAKLSSLPVPEKV